MPREAAARFDAICEFLDQLGMAGCEFKKFNSIWRWFPGLHTFAGLEGLAGFFLGTVYKNSVAESEKIFRLKSIFSSLARMFASRPHVIVCGAGPAGSSAAYHLARGGLRVTLLEKTRFPREKTCGDALVAAALQGLARMGVDDLFAPESVGATRIHSIGPEGASFVLPLEDAQSVRIVPRKRLDERLARQAAAAGAELREGVRIESIIRSSTGVVVRCQGGETLQGDLVLGCDGVQSVVRRDLDPEHARLRRPAIAFRGYFADAKLSDPQALVFVYSRALLPFYGWIFPLPEGGANIGVGLASEASSANVREAYQQFLTYPFVKRELQGASQVGRATGAWIPLEDLPPSGDRYLLAGDAAGFVNPVSGEGISYALDSGRFAAETALLAAERGDFSAASLAPYARRCSASFGRSFRLSRGARDAFLRPDRAEALMQICASDPQTARDAVELTLGLVAPAVLTRISERLLAAEEWPVALQAAAGETRIAFAPIAEGPGQLQFRRELNQVIFRLPTLLPRSLQSPAAHLLLQYGGRAGNPFDYFANYPTPSWSALYWLDRKTPGLDPELRAAALEAHALALFLHSLDDHLNDGQVRPSHLTLQVRTEAWRSFEAAALRLASAAETGNQMVHDFIAEYYSGVHEPAACESLADYQDLTFRQGSTWRVVPELWAEIWKDRDAAAALRASVAGFIYAYRLTDDVEDWRDDAFDGETSAVAIALSGAGRERWRRCRGVPEAEDAWSQLEVCIAGECVFEQIGVSAAQALGQGAEQARRAGLDDYALELETRGATALQAYGAPAPALETDRAGAV